jgi:hypothetical protein
MERKKKKKKPAPALTPSTTCAPSLEFRSLGVEEMSNGIG